MNDQLITESSCAAVVRAPIEFVDISAWLFNLPDAEYQRCSPAHIAAAATTTDDGRRVSINVETIGGSLMVQHYVEDISKKDHCRVLSTSDVLTPTGWTKIKVIWELSVKAIDKDRCELTNRVMGSSTPEFLHYLAKAVFHSSQPSSRSLYPLLHTMRKRHPSSPRVSKRRHLRRRRPLASRSALVRGRVNPRNSSSTND